jgi:hypothetical protein
MPLTARAILQLEKDNNVLMAILPMPSDEQHWAHALVARGAREISTCSLICALYSDDNDARANETFPLHHNP